MLSRAHMFDGEIDEAMGTTRRQLELNPNDADSNRDLAANLLFLGRWEEALRQVDVAQRLNPLDAAHLVKCHSIAATALIALRRYEEAIERSHLGAAADPSAISPILNVVSAEAHRGNLVAARQHAAEVLKRRPEYTIRGARASRGSMAPAYRAGIDHIAEGLRLAGLPEGSATPDAPVAGR
jgi:tetratricopeptide (TPR) repeat protein